MLSYLFEVCVHRWFRQSAKGLELLYKVLLEGHAVPVSEAIVLFVNCFCDEVQIQIVFVLLEEECTHVGLTVHWRLYQWLHRPSRCVQNI